MVGQFLTQSSRLKVTPSMCHISVGSIQIQGSVKSAGAAEFFGVYLHCGLLCPVTVFAVSGPNST